MREHPSLPQLAKSGLAIFVPMIKGLDMIAAHPCFMQLYRKIKEIFKAMRPARKGALGVF